MPTLERRRSLMGRAIHSRLLRVILIAGLAGSVVAVSDTPALASISSDQFEECLLDRINDDRRDADSPPVAMASDLSAQVREWSEWMSLNEFQHMTSSVRDPILPDDTTTWGENIAWHSHPDAPDCKAIHERLMDSDAHRSTILSKNFRLVAIGAHVDSSGWWVTELFFSTPACEGSFCDDDDSIFRSAIEKIAAAGITKGCNPPTNDRFCPDQYVTRGAMAAFLSRALSLPTGTSIDFIDDNGSIFEGAIERLAAAGITKGCNPPTNDRFCPDQYVTRGAMAAFLARALKL